jgi:23S rRNA (uracil1939-C5)-methyltransferase
MDELREITLTTLTYGGDALGRLPDGQAVFVPFGLLGERVRVRLLEARRGHARAVLQEVLEPAPERVKPRCIHFGICGGCHYQHMGYAAQLGAKKEILGDQLRRIGRIESPPVRETVASPGEWNYRNHVQFHLTREGSLGYVRHPAAPGSEDPVMAITECHLPEEPLNTLWPQLEFEPGTGIERVSLRAGDELLMALESGEPEAPEMEIEAGISVVHLYKEHPVVLAGEEAVRIEVLGRSFRVSAGSFFQVNTSMAEKMVGHVLERLPASMGTVLDLYCGVGLFSAFLAGHCARLIGVESSEAACEDFAANLDEFENVELYQGLAEAVLPHLEAELDAAVVDPPRAGLERRALDALLALRPGRLVYVSCDPSTLARDARRLIDGGYELVEVTPFDLFPQTYHIESISIFERRGD